MKKNYFTLLLMFISVTAFAQYSINFDTFTTGDVTQDPHIVPWPAGTVVPQVTTAQASSPPHSMNVRNNTTDDILFKLGDKNSGTWVVSWKMYLNGTDTGYWNIQEEEIFTTGTWNADFYVGATGSGGSAGVITHDQSGTTISYPSGVWFDVKITVNLGSSTISMEVDGNNMLTNETYPGLQLGAINFYSIDANNNYYIDDFMLYEDCYIPQNIAVSNITDATANFSWSLAATETGGYNYFLMLSGEDPDSDTPVDMGTTAAGATTVQVTGMSPLTNYDFYLQSNCDNSNVSDYSIVTSFTSNASCNATTVTSFPYTEDFENDSGSLGCWTQAMEVGNFEWSLYEGALTGNIATAHSGIQNITFVTESTVASPVTKYISPMFDLTSVANPGLMFYYAQENYFGDNNTLKVYYRISDQDAWVELMHYDSPVDVWTEAYLDLPNPSATYQLAFEGINNFGYANVIDDITVGNNLVAIDKSAMADVNLYPNPTNGILNLNSESIIDSYQIMDVTGKLISQKEVQGTHPSIDVNHLNSGVYFITIIKNNTSKTLKFIKN